MSTKRKKGPAPRLVKTHNPAALRATFRPLEELLDMLQNTGTVLYMNGRPAIRTIDGLQVDIQKALNGVIDGANMYLQRKGKNFSVACDALSRLIARLEYCTPVDESLIAQARKELAELRELWGNMGVRTAMDIVNTLEIKVRLGQIETKVSRVPRNALNCYGV